MQMTQHQGTGAYFTVEADEYGVYNYVWFTDNGKIVDTNKIAVYADGNEKVYEVMQDWIDNRKLPEGIFEVKIPE